MQTRAGAALLALVFAGIGAACRQKPSPARRLPTRVDLAALQRLYGEPLYSQDDEETLIRAFFGDRRGGFFLDVGAGDPIRHSTTYYLEKHLNWNGLAVDAIAEYAEAYARKRPGTRFASYYAGQKSEGWRDFFVSEERDFSSGTGTDPRGGRYRKRTVPTIALDDLLHREGVTRLDFLSMDIEGAETAALAGLDLGRWRPDLACIEISSPESGRAVAERFVLAGCREVTAYRVADPINRYYTCR
ncbi:MAG: FkbM family methyltransferase [Deltaproteobacteria bacterium]|nr:FkbM family methyltransferase [Deltaproteobacteria bacterium]